jgi:hypothetical protein
VIEGKIEKWEKVSGRWYRYVNVLRIFKVRINSLGLW